MVRYGFPAPTLATVKSSGSSDNLKTTFIVVFHSIFRMSRFFSSCVIFCSAAGFLLLLCLAPKASEAVKLGGLLHQANDIIRLGSDAGLVRPEADTISFAVTQFFYQPGIPRQIVHFS
jgi:hypothetical protein